MREEQEPLRSPEQVAEDAATVRFIESLERTQSAQEIRIMLLDWKTEKALQGALDLLRQVRCQGRVLRILGRDLGKRTSNLIERPLGVL